MPVVSSPIEGDFMYFEGTIPVFLAVSPSQILVLLCNSIVSIISECCEYCGLALTLAHLPTGKSGFSDKLFCGA